MNGYFLVVQASRLHSCGIIGDAGGTPTPQWHNGQWRRIVCCHRIQYPMRAVRRHNLRPRLEMLPLIDVIFLLLTFFIYSMVVMIQADVLPVTLTPLASAAEATSGHIETITINRDGQIFFNREQMSLDQVPSRLAQVATDPLQPTLFLAMEQNGNMDRGPLLVQLIERSKHAGIKNIAFVGSTRSTPNRSSTTVDIEPSK